MCQLSTKRSTSLTLQRCQSFALVTGSKGLQTLHHIQLPKLGLLYYHAMGFYPSLAISFRFG